MQKLLFAYLLLGVLPGRIAAADDQAEARAILDKAIAAQGGEAAMGKFVGVHFRGNVTAPAGDKVMSLTGESYTQRYDQACTVVVNETLKTRVVDVVNGKYGWIKRGDSDAQDMTEAQVLAWHESVYAMKIRHLLPLKNPAFKLSPIDEIKVEGRPAVGILVRHEDHAAIKLYFDKESYLEVRSSRRRMDVDLGREVLEEYVYSDFRTVQGVKQAFKSTGYRDGVKIMDLVQTLVEYSEKPLDEKHFAKP